MCALTRLLIVVVFLQTILLGGGCIGKVDYQQKISSTEGGFTGSLANDEHFGDALASLDDVDGDGVTDLAVGAPYDFDGGTYHGAVWVLFLNTDGTVRDYQKISDTEGGFTGGFTENYFFGTSVASLGDLDGDGVTELAVGASGDDDGGSTRGAVWVLFLDSDGTVKGHQKISDIEGGFSGTLADSDIFGMSVASLGDLDGDGVTDLAVGASGDDDGGSSHGAVWVLFLDSDGTVKSHQKISDTDGGFSGTLADYNGFGMSVASFGDLDGDGVTDLAVGAPYDSDGGIHHGAVWVLFLNSDGTVKGHQKISDTEGRFSGTLDDFDCFGMSVASTGDFDGNGTPDLAVGAPYDDDGGNNPGAFWVLILNEDGTVGQYGKYSNLVYLIGDPLDDEDHFGFSISLMGDLRHDDTLALAVGAPGNDDAPMPLDGGAVWLLFLSR